MNTARQALKRLRQPLLLTLCTLLLLSACNTAAPPTLEAAAEDTGFAFQVDPANEEVIPVGPTVELAAPTLQAQADGDTRLLVQGEDVRFKDFSFLFKSPNKLVVRLRVENITEDLDFTQPFSFTLSSTSNNIVTARAPLVTDQQLGGDGVLSPGETSKRFRFVVTFKEDEPFTFFVDARAVVAEHTACTSPVEIPDAALEEAIRNELGKQEGELTCEDLAALETLDTINVGVVESLEGLQFATNLSVLLIMFDDVSDLSPLENLTRLTTLNLSDNLITDISALVANSGLGEGDTIDLTDNPLSPQARDDIEVLRARGVSVSADEAGACISPVDIPDETLELNVRLELGKEEGELTCEDLEALDTLAVERAPVSSLEGLQFALNLTYLSLFDTGTSDLSPLANLSELSILYLTADEVSDLSPLANLTKLTQLDLYANNVSDLSPLANLTNLSSLRLDRNEISDLSPLAGLTNLSYLVLGNNDITDLSGLENLTALTYVGLDNNNIADLSALVANSSLDAGDRVRLFNNPLSSQALEDIEILRARGVEVELDEN